MTIFLSHLKWITILNIKMDVHSLLYQQTQWTNQCIYFCSVADDSFYSVQLHKVNFLLKPRGMFKCLIHQREHGPFWCQIGGQILCLPTAKMIDELLWKKENKHLIVLLMSMVFWLISINFLISSFFQILFGQLFDLIRQNNLSLRPKAKIYLFVVLGQFQVLC